MKSYIFRHAALMTAVTLVCIGVPAIAQTPDGFVGNHGSALSNANANLTGIFQKDMTVGYLASTISSSVLVRKHQHDTWVPVWDNGHDVLEDHPRKNEIRHVTVPEGGSPLLYLLLAGLSFCGALVFNWRRTHAPNS